MKLKSRLLTGFVGVACMSLIVGSLALRNMGVMNAGSTKMYQNELLGLSLIKQANIHILYAARAEKNFLLSSTEAQREKYYSDWEKNVATVKEFIDKASVKFYTPEGKKAIQSAQAAYEAWVPVTTKVIELEKSASLAKESEAVDLSIGGAREKVNALESAIQDATDRKDRNAQELAAMAEALYRQSLAIMIAVIASAMVIGILIGMGLSSSVLKTVGGEPAEIAALADQVAAGDLTQETSRIDAATGIYKALLMMVSRLKEVVSNMQTAANQVASGSQQLSATAQAMSQGATEQASSVEEISASMEEMSSNIKQNAENSQMTENIAQKSSLSAEEGGKAVTQTIDAMRQIASKIGIIEDIARSTNMLALNASIEAARAGEYGKGFAVVASEVGKLAERSQKEASEISKLSSESMKVSETAGQTILAMIPEIKRTADLVQEISASSSEQDSGARQINQAILQLDQVIQQNASSAEESASMSEELAGQAEEMQGTMRYFTIDAWGATNESPAGAWTRKETRPANPSARRRAAAQRGAIKGIDIALGDDVPTLAETDAVGGN